ncbi:MAG: response regulator [Oscillospiraceae bacterium]|nr:response regulator [Oscillospiraceae bacterium]
MYKLVIVEDEQDIRNRLVSMIEKSGCNFEIVAEYETGIDAYDGIMSDNPDLIMTDIKIPYISGIELVKKAREAYPLIRVIIITGYNEFDYAKEAANLGVLGFVSKPVTLDSIRDLLKKAEAYLDNEFVTGSNLNKLSAFYQENLPVIRENDLYRLSGASDVTPAFEARLRGNNIRLDYPYFAMCIFDLDEIPDQDAEQYDIIFSSVRKTIGEELENLCDYDMFNRYEKLCLILKYHAQPDIKELERRIERVIQRAGRYSDMPLSAGISSVMENSKNFSRLVKEATRALEYRSVMGGQKVFLYGNSQSGIINLAAGDSKIKELGYLLHSRTAEDCIQWIDSIRDTIVSSRDSLYYAATGILNILIRGCDDIEGLYARYGGLDKLYRKLFEIKTDEEIYDYLKELVVIVRELNDGVIVDDVERNLHLVMSYIETRFCDPDISFESLAREVGFSVSYISALLKKRLNTSFIKMLTELRIDKAKELLLNPALKIIDVAEQLGYNDSYYFSHCFKKHVGMPPKEFRNEKNRQVF